MGLEYISLVISNTGVFLNFLWGQGTSIVHLVMLESWSVLLCDESSSFREGSLDLLWWNSEYRTDDLLLWPVYCKFVTKLLYSLCFKDIWSPLEYIPPKIFTFRIHPSNHLWSVILPPLCPNSSLYMIANTKNG